MKTLINQKRRAQVLLLGDSICEGYREEVEKGLLGVADVHYVHDNARFTTYMLKYIHQWADDLRIGKEIDVVHFNAGLWDVLRIDGDLPLVDIVTYQKNLQRLVDRIRYVFPNAAIIFATTTPVLEEQLDVSFRRLNSDIEAYNRMASQVMAANSVTVNDLHQVASDLADLYIDGIHFCPEGYEILGENVVEVAIEEILKKTDLKFGSDEELSRSEIQSKHICIYGFGKYGRFVLALLQSGGGKCDMHSGQRQREAGEQP